MQRKLHGGRASSMRATARSMTSARRLRRQLSLPDMLLWRLLRLNRRELRFRIRELMLSALSAPRERMARPRF